MTKEEATSIVFQYLCGCGSPESGMDGLRALCKHHTYQEHKLEKSADDSLKELADALQVQNDGIGFWLILYLADALQLTEHGCGIRFGWLTDKGKELATALEYSNKELDEE
jgi:hypothetical protein